MNLLDLEVALRDDVVVQHGLEHVGAGEPELIVGPLDLRMAAEQVVEVGASEDIGLDEKLGAYHVNDLCLIRVR